MTQMRFGDTAAMAWLADLLKLALREEPGCIAGVDMSLLTSMCRAEPKHAQMAMQMMAYELEKQMGTRPVSEASGVGETLRLLLGSTFLAYCTFRGSVVAVLKELEFVLNLHPIILRCAEFVTEWNLENFEP